MTSILPIDPDIEVQPTDENLAIERIRTLVDQKVRADNPIDPKQQKPVQRDAHPKAHGAVRATFEIAGDLPPECRWGVFSRPETFKAWVRFSNGQEHDDRTKDARGMAIKLCGVEGEKILAHEKSTQDFVLMDFPHFFIHSAAQYASFVRQLRKGRKWLFFVHPKNWVAAWKASKLPRHAHNPLALRYFSQVPYKLGPHAVKYSARPRTPPEATGGGGENHLREAMKKTLAERDVVFDFLVQFQTDARRMSVEDSTVTWSEDASPWTKVATVRIGEQVFDSEAQLAFAENLSFNPWHTLPDHAPLGNLNRVRRAVYVHIAGLRHGLNNVQHYEPNGDETFTSAGKPDTGSESSGSD